MTKTFARHDSTWNVLLLERGSKLEVKKNMAAVNKTGFYLYKNCFYDIQLKNHQHIGGRLADIKEDTLFFTNHFNDHLARLAGESLDTFPVFYKELDQLNLIADRAMGLYNKISLDRYDFIFRKDTTNYLLPGGWAQIYSNDSTRYELVAHLTAQGIGYLYEEDGRTVYYYGTGLSKPDRSMMDLSYNTKNYFWYTPCEVEEINGIALGFQASNIKNEMYDERDSLVVRGLNIEVSPIAMFALAFGRLDGPYPDSIALYQQSIKEDWSVKVHGLNISVVGAINEMRIKGVNISGLITTVDEIHGLSISGVSNFSYIMNGVSISVLRNRCGFAKGVQLGLFNKTAELRGFQFGLWNRNGKRALPFINWQFKQSKA